MSNWGGKRKGAGSGGKREGAGRPREKIKLGRPGTIWFMEKSEINGLPEKPRRLCLLSVSDDEIEFQDVETEELISIRNSHD